MPTRRNLSGFTLIEALVALVLASAGLLGVARLQIAVSTDGGAAAQRLEAQRLLSDKIESFRALDAAQIATLQSGSDAPSTATNTSYTRTWSVASAGDPLQRVLAVAVNWTDRAGQPQSLSSSTLLQIPEGRMLAALAQPLAGLQSLRGPLDRYIDVPLPAQLVGDGRSAFTILNAVTNQTVTFVADDTNGRVIQRCANAPSLTQVLNSVAGCTAYNGVVLSGFVGGANQVVSLNLGPLSLPLSVTIPYPSGVNTSEITGADPSRPIECEYRQAYTDPGVVLSLNGSSTYRYTCVIPLAANSTGWSGYLQMAGVISLSVNATVCRYRFPDVAGSDPNRRNVQQYRNVNQSLFNQNYLFVVGPLLGLGGSQCSGLEDGLLVEHQRCLALGLACGLNKT